METDYLYIYIIFCIGLLNTSIKYLFKISDLAQHRSMGTDSPDLRPLPDVTSPIPSIRSSKQIPHIYFLFLHNTSQRQAVDLSIPYYIERLYEIDQTDIPFLNLNLSHVKAYSEALYRKIVAYPACSVCNYSVESEVDRGRFSFIFGCGTSLRNVTFMNYYKIFILGLKSQRRVLTAPILIAFN
uniref:MCM_N domain-containing protein n=1 Tax=Heterorhabditis bacteriophora TaxID=37862 RepID=A0A1I7WXX8_HETBA